jgi:hypothetical protein
MAGESWFTIGGSKKAQVSNSSMGMDELGRDGKARRGRSFFFFLESTVYFIFLCFALLVARCHFETRVCACPSLPSDPRKCCNSSALSLALLLQPSTVSVYPQSLFSSVHPSLISVLTRIIFTVLSVRRHRGHSRRDLPSPCPYSSFFSGLS